MKSFNANLRRMYVLLVCFLLLFGLGVSLAQSIDISSIIHTFHNTHKADTYNDLHIEYTQTIGGKEVSNPEITPAKGAKVTGWTKSSKTIDIKGSFPPNSKVEVKSYSGNQNVKVKKYWWTLNKKK